MCIIHLHKNGLTIITKPKNNIAAIYCTFSLFIADPNNVGTTSCNSVENVGSMQSFDDIKPTLLHGSILTILYMS